MFFFSMYLVVFIVLEIVWFVSIIVQTSLTKEFPGPDTKRELRWLISVWWWPLTWPYHAARLLYRTLREISSLIKE